MNHKKILLIDDDSMMNLLQKKIVSRYFPLNAIAVFENAAEALLEIEKQSDSSFLIFLDLNMPIMNGWKFMEQLKEKNHIHRTTIIILTSSIDHQDQVDALSSLGVVKFISKPFTGEKIDTLLEVNEIQPFVK